MSDAPRDLPQALPGREPDDALGLGALDDVRRRIVAQVEAGQGAWQRLPAWRRAAPLVLGAAAALAFACWGLARGPASPSAWLAMGASLVAWSAVAAAPRRPGRGERVATAALVLGALALGLECALSVRAPPVAGNGLTCIGAILAGAALPVAFAAVHLRRAHLPGRWGHAAAVAAGGGLAAMGAVWAECPASGLAHVGVAHVLVPTGAAALVVVALRGLLRDRSVPR